MLKILLQTYIIIWHDGGHLSPKQNSTKGPYYEL